jgi:hypothetical protein
LPIERARSPENGDHQVFISYAFEDQALADQIVRTLESNGVRCWIANRDIPAGASYAKRIPAAIRACGVLLVVLSQHANASEDVVSEVRLAKMRKIPRVPFVTDAAGKEPEAAIPALLNAIKRHLQDLVPRA